MLQKQVQPGWLGLTYIITFLPVSLLPASHNIQPPVYLTHISISIMWCQGIEAERHHCTGSFFRKMRSSYWIDNTDNDSQPMVINHQPKLPLDYKKRP